MEEDEMPKFPRNHIGNGKMGLNGRDGDEEEGDEDLKRGGSGGGGGGGGGSGGGGGRGRGNGGAPMEIANNNHGGGLSKLYNWPSSRIFRVSRASGGKDRHSKVWTSKGLRDRRVRLSVPTAIQFYDLQDRLGYDQPSKAVEWLLTAAATSIAELPSITTPFPDTPQQLTDARRSSTENNQQRSLDLAEVEIDDEEDENLMFQQQQESNGLKNLSKSACSSTSETSKGSGLSFSRPESRIKARERARERAAGKEKEKEIEGSGVGHQKLNPISQNSSFTELLTSGIHSNNHCPSGNGNQNESNFFQKREWMPSASMEYFGSSFLSPSNSRPNFLGQIQLGNPLHQPVSSSPLMFSVAGDQNQHFSFQPDHLVPVVVRGGGHGGGGSSSNNNNGDYDLNFSVSSGYNNRGTLQSNSSSSPSMLPQIQRFPTIDGPSAFFISPTNTTPVTNASVPGHHHQHFLSGFDPQLQLCYDNNSSRQHHDHNKGKGKNSAS